MKKIWDNKRETKLDTEGGIKYNNLPILIFYINVTPFISISSLSLCAFLSLCLSLSLYIYI